MSSADVLTDFFNDALGIQEQPRQESRHFIHDYFVVKCNITDVERLMKKFSVLSPEIIIR